MRVWSWGGDGAAAWEEDRTGQGSGSCRAAPVSQGLSQTQQKGKILARALLSPKPEGQVEAELQSPSCLRGAPKASPGLGAPFLQGSVPAAAFPCLSWCVQPQPLHPERVFAKGFHQLTFSSRFLLPNISLLSKLQALRES